MPSSHHQNRRKTLATSNPSASNTKYDATRRRIEQMELQREERRLQAEVNRVERKERSAKLQAAGNPGDVDFIGMVEEWRSNQQQKIANRNRSTTTATAASSANSASSNIIVAIRKRPMSNKEVDKKDHDSVTCIQPKVWIHSAKFKVDGITKYLTHTDFRFDYTFGENSTTDQVYTATTLPLLDYVLETRKRGTIFAYGQTGSGKTYTMSSIQRILAHDLFEELQSRQMDVDVTLTFFEFYGGTVQDLLHGRTQCKILEDGKGEVNIIGLKDVPAGSPNEFLDVIEQGHSQRTTHTTEANDTSSRSHAICQVYLREKHPSSRKREKLLLGKLTLVDLAGSERGSDTKMHNSQRRSESADINQSLLALKECIRALGQKNSHVPYRQSKLTMILKDCFSSDSKTTMIATVSPGASATDHSLNTCRYAERIKEHKVAKVSSSSHRKRTSKGPDQSISKIGKPSKDRLKRISMICNSGGSDRTDLVESPSNSLSNNPRVAPQQHIESSSTLSGMSQSFEEQSNPDLDHQESNDDEAMFRQSIRDGFEIQDELATEHMRKICGHTELIAEELRTIKEYQGITTLSDVDIESYIGYVEEALKRKEDLMDMLDDRIEKSILRIGELEHES